MKTKKTLFVILSVVILLALSVSFVTAQDEQPPDDDIVASDLKTAAMGDEIEIQGRLTNASGNPVANGLYTIVASLYDVSSGGTARCSDNDSVTVTDGVFNMVMDFCESADFNGDLLYLGIKVGSDAEMTPRKPIYAVPYAWGLHPGAIVQGADSYLWVPGASLIKNYSSDTTRWDIDWTTALIYSGNAGGGNRTVMLPITIPSVLYGVPVTVTEMRVYYKCTNGTNGYITSTALFKGTDADSHQTLISNATNHTGTSASYYTLATDPLYSTLSATQGILSAEFTLTFADNSSAVYLMGIRLTLDHTP